MNRNERWLALAFSLLVFTYVLLRAIFVPTFHDEAATFFHYIVPGKFVPFKAHWDANNHFLNSALAYFSYKLFGPDLIWIRLPNVLSFLVFAAYSFLIARSLKTGFLRSMLFIALLTAAFPLEFFAQARGYGMSLAFLVAAIYHGAEFLRHHAPKHQLAIWFWMILAVAANLALINSYLIFIGLIAFSMLFSRGARSTSNVLILTTLGLAVLGLAAFYGFELRERGLLYTGFDSGFLEVTVASLIRYQLGSDVNTLRWIVAILGAVSGGYILWKWYLNSYEWTSGNVAAALLLLNALGSVLLNRLFGMNFPENRVGLYYVPLFIIVLSAALDAITINKPKAQYLGLILLFFPLHLLSTLSLDTTLLWPKWHVSKNLYQKAVAIQRQHSQPLMVSGDYLNELGWAVYNFQNNGEMQPIQVKPVPDTLADLIIARPTDFNIGSIGYDTVFHDVANEVYLLQRNRELTWRLDSSVQLMRTSFGGSDEFYELLNDSIGSLHARRGCFMLQGMIKSENAFSDAHLIFTSYNSNGEGLSYDFIPLHWIRPSWENDQLNLRRTFSFPEDAVSIKMYLWNINRHQLEVSIQHFAVFEAAGHSSVDAVE